MDIFDELNKIKLLTTYNFLTEDTSASKQAKKMGLTYQGWGQWSDGSNRVVARTVDGGLKKIDVDHDVTTSPLGSKVKGYKSTQEEQTSDSENPLEYLKMLTSERTSKLQSAIESEDNESVQYVVSNFLNKPFGEITLQSLKSMGVNEDEFSQMANILLNCASEMFNILRENHLEFAKMISSSDKLRILKQYKSVNEINEFEKNTDKEEVDDLIKKSKPKTLMNKYDGFRAGLDKDQTTKQTTSDKLNRNTKQLKKDLTKSNKVVPNRFNNPGKN